MILKHFPKYIEFKLSAFVQSLQTMRKALIPIAVTLGKILFATYCIGLGIFAVSLAVDGIILTGFQWVGIVIAYALPILGIMCKSYYEFYKKEEAHQQQFEREMEKKLKSEAAIMMPHRRKGFVK